MSLTRDAEQLDAIIYALVDAANDKNEDVQRAICASLQKLGSKKPDNVLITCSFYLTKHPKLPTRHRIVLLKTIYRVCDATENLASMNLCTTIIKQAAEEMIFSKEISPEWQGAASAVLVSMGKKYCHEVMKILLLKLQPGIVPHFFVVHTLAHLTTANVFEMVPFIKSVLGNLLSVMGAMHHDNIKWITIYAIARFGDALLEYVANIDKAPDATVKKEMYETEFNIALDSMLTWMNAKEIKLRLVIVEAMGPVSHLISRDKYEEHLSRIVPLITALYKQQYEMHVVTQSLGMILDAGFKHDSEKLGTYLDNIMYTLFPQVCDIPDYSDPGLVKNHNEVLRCYCLIAKYSIDGISQILFCYLESSNERNKVGALTVMRHLINTSDEFIGIKIPTLLEILKKNIVTDNSFRVKQVLVHLIVSLAHHGYLDNDIGPIFLEFLIYESGGFASEKFAINSSNQLSICTICENALHVLTTTVPNVERVFWPRLLNYIVPAKYTKSIGVICKNAGYYASKLRNSDSIVLEIDYSKLNTISDEWTLFARFFVLLGFLNEERKSILELMKALSPTLHKNLVARWDSEIPHLSRLDSSKETSEVARNAWEESVLEFLWQSINDIDEENWAKALGQSLSAQIKSYSDSLAKAFLFRCLGEVLRKVRDEHFVHDHLELVYSSTTHSNLIEREGCAKAFARTAVSHANVVMASLEVLGREDSNKKHTGLFSFFIDSRTESEQDAFKSTILLSYGFTWKEVPVSIFTSKYESSAIKHFLPYFQQAKTDDLKISLLRAVYLVLDTAHCHHVTISNSVRQQLLRNIVEISMMNTNNNNLILLCLQCVTHLLQLDPLLPIPEWEKCIKCCLQKIYNLSPDIFEYASLLDALDFLLQVMLEREPTPENLHFITSTLESWLCSLDEEERRASLNSLAKLLDCFLTIFLKKEEISIRFNPVGAILARTIPRISDTNVQIRQLALSSIMSLFRLAAALEGFSENYFESSLKSLENIQNQLTTDDADYLFQAVKTVGQTIAVSLPAHQLISILHVLFDNMVDPVTTSSAGVCIVINEIVKNRGGELHQQVDVLLQLLVRQLKVVDNVNTRKVALQLVRHLANHHLTTVINYLLNCSTPYDRGVIESWRLLAQDSNFSNIVLQDLYLFLSQNCPTMEHPDPRNKKFNLHLASHKSVAVILAMKELFHQVEMQPVACAHFSQIFSILLLVCGAFVSSYPSCPPNMKENTMWPPVNILDKVNNSSPVRIAVETFRSFLLCAGQEAIIQESSDNGCWLNFESDRNFPEAVVCLARAICLYSPQYLSAIVSHLSFSLTNTLVSYRIVSVAFFAELINQRCCGNSILLELVLSNLVNTLVDSSNIVRRLCMKGLGYVGQIETDENHKYSQIVLPAMLVGLDDKEDSDGDIILEAMSGLSKVLLKIDASLVAPILISILLRIRICFDHIRADIRSAAFVLFGDLSKFGSGDCRMDFAEQIHNNLIAILLHLNEEDKSVIKSCKYALRCVGELINCESLNSKFQKHLLAEVDLHYGEFMNDLAKILINNFAEKIPLYVTSCMIYFKSNWAIIQANSAMFVGYLLSSLPLQNRGQISKEAVCTGLILSLKSNEKEVRLKAAESLSLLHDY